MTRGAPTITIRLRGDLKARLSRAAAEDGRTVTAIAEHELSEWLRRRELIKQAPVVDTDRPSE